MTSPPPMKASTLAANPIRKHFTSSEMPQSTSEPPFIAVLLPAALPDLLWIKRLLQAKITLIDDLSPFSRKSSVHRGRVRTPNGTQWVYIPVLAEDRLDGVPICNARIDSDTGWRVDFWKALEFNYRNSVWFDHFEFDLRRDIDTIAGMSLYSEAARFLVNRVLGYLEIRDLIPDPLWLSDIIDGTTEPGAPLASGTSGAPGASGASGTPETSRATEASGTPLASENQKNRPSRYYLSTKAHEEQLFTAVTHLSNQFLGSENSCSVVFEPDSRNYQLRGRLADLEISPAITHPIYRQHFGGFQPGCCLLDLLFEVGPDCWRHFTAN